MANPLKTVRRVVQIALLALFAWLLWQARWHGPGASAPPPIFLRMDPLAALVSWLSPTPLWARLLMPAGVTLILTAILGRVFCGWICPLGTVIDIFDHVFVRRRKKRRPDLNRPAWKYYILGVVLVAALFGTQLAWLLDPIPLLTRTCATVVYPIVVGAYDVAVIRGRPLLEAVGLRLDPAAVTPTFALNLPVLLVFATVLGLSFISRRFWCRTLCPLGALLSVVGRFAILRRRVEGCVSCSRCRSDCKMGAIPDPPEGAEGYCTTLAAECIQCFDCLVCPQEGISAIAFRGPSEGWDRKTQVTKRRFIASLGLGALYGMTAATGAARRPTNSRLIRPPGAIIRTPNGIRRMTESEFRDLCLRCGECMRACVTGGLQPAVTEAGFDGVFTPVLVPKLGHCEQTCTACGQVCPSGALGPFLAEEKARITLGLATVHTDKCLAWRRGDLYKLCIVCDEHCPYDAIEMVANHDGEKAPVVDADICVGCGLCESACPVKPEAAIVVYRSDAGV